MIQQFPIWPSCDCVELCDGGKTHEKLTNSNIQYHDTTLCIH